MAPTYDQVTRAEVCKRMSPPSRESLTKISRETGITRATLYNWKRAWKQEGQLVPATGKHSEHWSATDKFAVVLQTATLNSCELGSYCRERGLYPEQVARWRKAAQDANDPTVPSMNDHKELQRLHQADKKEIKRLQRELQRKEKALAEAATLLVLQKKWQAFLSEEEVD